MHSFMLLFLAVIVCFVPTINAQVTSSNFGLFQGNFSGIAFGEGGTSAPLTLNFTQNGTDVIGSATIFPGISVNTGGLVCPGIVTIPSGTIDINGNISKKNPRQLVAKSGLTTSGMKITAEMAADLSLDGNTAKIQIKLNIPWPCRSPTIKGDLVRLNG